MEINSINKIYIFSVELDNGYNYNNYMLNKLERESIVKEYNKGLLNMNTINSISEINQHIDKIREDINYIKLKNESLMASLKDFDILFNYEEAETLSKRAELKKASCNNETDHYPLFIIILLFSLGVLSGKIINFLI